MYNECTSRFLGDMKQNHLTVNIGHNDLYVCWGQIAYKTDNQEGSCSHIK